MTTAIHDHMCVHNDSPLPTIYIVSDSLGATAHVLARAACAKKQDRMRFPILLKAILRFPCPA